MTMFWIVAALFVSGALLLIVPALLRPPAAAVSSRGANLAVHGDQWREAEADAGAGLLDTAQLDRARRDTQRRAAEDGAIEEGRELNAGPARRTAIAIVLLLPLASALIYLQLGDPGAAAPQVKTAQPGRHELTQEQVQQRVAALAERLKSDPGNADGWITLGRSYTALGRWRDAAAALRKAAELQPRDASLLADLADITGMAQGKRLAGEPARLVQRALDIDPRHVKALALAGSVSLEAREYAQARHYWQRLLDEIPSDSPMARSVRGSMLEATQLDAGSGNTFAAPAAAPLTGHVELSPELASRVAPGDTLFVFARAVQGPRMPLAIQRSAAGDAARERQPFTLDDSTAMSPARRLSSAGAVIVGARITKSGSATPASGDLVGESQPVAPGSSGAKGLVVRIDRVLP